MRGSFLVATALLVLAACLTVQSSVPWKNFGEAEKANALRVVNAARRPDGGFGQVELTFHAISVLSALNSPISDAADLCERLAKGLRQEGRSAAFLSYALRAQQKLPGCTTEKPLASAVEKLQSVLSSDATSLEDLYHATQAALVFGKDASAQSLLSELPAVADRFIDLMQDDGTFRPFSDSAATEGSSRLAGLAYEALGAIASALKGSDREGVVDSLQPVIDSIESLLNHGEASIVSAKESRQVIQFEDRDPHTVATVAIGIHSLLSVASDLSSVSLPYDKLDGMAAALLEASKVATPKNAHFVISGLRALADNPAHTPIAVLTRTTQPFSSMLGAPKNFEVQVTDLFGETSKVASAVKLNLVGGWPIDDESKNVFQKQQLKSSSNGVFSFAPMDTKPSQGMYRLRVEVEPTSSSSKLHQSRFYRSLKVVTTADLDSIQAFVSPSSDYHAIPANQRNSLKASETLKSALSAQPTDHIHVFFRVKSSDGKGIKLHQPFVLFKHVKSGSQSFFVASLNKDGIYHLDVNLNKQETIENLNSQSGEYEITLVLGDVLIVKPFFNKLGSVKLTLSAQKESTTAAERVAAQLSPLPEIKHVFNLPEKRPSLLLSNAFTAIVLIPLVVFVLWLLATGVKTMRSPPSFVNAAAFQLSLGALLLLLVAFWLKLNLAQTLWAMLVLVPICFFFGLRALSDLNIAKHKKTE